VSATTRIAFDPAASFIVAAEELVIASVKLARGAPFPWRELNVQNEHELWTLWLAFKIDVAPELQPRDMSPGETLEDASALIPGLPPSEPIAAPGVRGKKREPRAAR
jgi:hypothetical protein